MTRILFFILFLLLSGCFGGGHQAQKDGPPRFAVNTNNILNPTPRYEPKSRYGNPSSYVVYGKRYHVLNSVAGYKKHGIASWYGTKFNRQLTSTRERYNMLAMTGASPDLPIPCYVRVTNLQNHRSVIVRINDRGPFAPNRIIDLSYVAAKKLGMTGTGTARVQVAAIDMNPKHKEHAILAHNQSKRYLQVAAFKARSSANRLKFALSNELNRAVRIHARGALYRVQIGPLRTEEESNYLQHQLAREGYHHLMTVVG